MGIPISFTFMDFEIFFLWSRNQFYILNIFSFLFPQTFLLINSISLCFDPWIFCNLLAGCLYNLFPSFWRSIVEFSFTTSDPVHFEVNWVSIPSSVYMWASLIAVFQETRHVCKIQGNKILYLNNLFQLTPTLMFDFTVTIIGNCSVFMMEESDCSRKESSITPPPNENRDNPRKRGKGEGLPCHFFLECRARLLEKIPEWRFD